MLVAHGGGICPIEVWAALGALTAAGGARMLWGMLCLRCKRIFRRGEYHPPHNV